MSGKRTYDDGCAAAYALDLVGERWALLVVRELMLEPKRFTDLEQSLPGISPNVLTQRLKDLEAAAIVARHRLPPPAAVQVYALTDWGRELEPVLMALGRWAVRSPALPVDRPLSLTALILSLRTMFDAAAAAGLEACLELRLDGRSFAARVADGHFAIEPGAPDTADVTIEATVAAFAAVVYGGRPLADALAAGEFRIAGAAASAANDAVAIAERFVAAFPLPEAAG